ncbi:hypothetical protein D1B33_16490 [Lysinibacillus yapensis]|uniref:Uncharacterized protein n=1 Tax=Ureibacillus yapensis TaxID=2304605 RepID=A0A396S3Y3_9BACL|nr:hypothetical protein [Lysinibacillus yapensis]RHW32765.1 hypothetical protein D1B33_16490 [Lysinibacillus yapensis]
MLKVDEQVLKESNGKSGQPLEEAIFRLSNRPDFQQDIFGAMLPIDSLLVNRTRAQNLIFSIAKKYWGKVDLFLHAALHEISIDLENANDRIEAFFSSPQGKKALFDYLTIHNELQFENLMALVLNKDLKLPKFKSVGGLRQIHLYQVGSKYFVQAILNDRFEFWDALFSKKIYSLFMQAPLNSIQQANELIKRFRFLVETYSTLNQSVITTNQLITYIDQENVRSYQLKELHLYNVISHFNGGKRHFQKIDALIEDIIANWGTGKWALSEKEFTLLIYIKAITAAHHKITADVMEYGKYLIMNDRLTNHSIELLLEYSDVLPNLKPEPDSLVKRYDKNYLEQIFYILIDALIQNEKYSEVVQLIQQHEIASCMSIYEYFDDAHHNEDALFKIEATVQRDIAFIVHNSPQYILQSVEEWLKNYNDEKSAFYEIASMTSSHLCNLLKAFFATEHYELFEKLMEVYKKYLKIDSHFNDLRDFVSAYVKN